MNEETTLQRLSRKAEEMGFVMNTKFFDLTNGYTFTISEKRKFDTFGKDNQLYVGVQPNRHGNSTARIYKDGVWAKIIEKPNFVLPDKWFIEVTKENDKILSNWRNHNAELEDGFLHYPKNNTYIKVNSEWSYKPIPGYTEITFDEFKEHVLNKQNKDNMTKGYTITREQFKELYNVSCTGWREKITGLIKKTIDTFENEGVLNDGQVREMFNAISNNKQREAFDKIFPNFNGMETLDSLRGKGEYFNTGKVRVEHAPLLGIRSQGEYKDCAFALDKRFNWELKVDSLGIKVLIPSRKK